MVVVMMMMVIIIMSMIMYMPCMELCVIYFAFLFAVIPSHHLLVW